MSIQVSEEARAAVHSLAGECRQCFQCGQCRGACPNGFELDRGPRRVVRLILSEDVEQLLACEDVWRCSECRACSDVCPMEVDVAGMMAAVRELQVGFGGVRCAERKSAEIAAKRLARRTKIDNMLFGTQMAHARFRSQGSARHRGHGLQDGDRQGSPAPAHEHRRPDGGQTLLSPAARFPRTRARSRRPPRSSASSASR